MNTHVRFLLETDDYLAYISQGLYVNSLALQAVVDRWTTMSNEAAQAQNKPSASNNASFHVLMELYRVNEPFIQEVVDASRRILTTVLEGLVPGDHLKHAPVRTCFRILSGMIFILKVCLFLNLDVATPHLNILDVHPRCERR